MERKSKAERSLRRRPRTLVVTGLLAESIVERSLEKTILKPDVMVLPSSVAALMTPRYIAQELKEKGVEGYELILLPGLVRGDVSYVGEATGIPTIKGPVHAADLPLVLGELGRVEFSTTTPADKLLGDLVKRRVGEELDAIGRRMRERLERDVRVVLGEGKRKIWTGRGTFPLILAEIVDAPTLPPSEIREMAEHYIGSGADVIDVGMVAGGGNAEAVSRCVDLVKRTTPNALISLDTEDEGEIEVGVKRGVDLILSINSKNMGEVSCFAGKTPVVVTPKRGDGTYPSDYPGKVEELERAVAEARSLGFTTIIADPILTPPSTPNMVESLVAYFLFAQRNPETPLLMGSGNVTELVDGDSIGMNALLASIGVDIGVDLHLTTEASDKTRGCVRELAQAVRMMTLAKRRGAPPKDLGVSLMGLKELRRRDEAGGPALSPATPRIKAVKVGGVIDDPKGCFKISIDPRRGEMALVHYPPGGGEPGVVIEGSQPDQIYATAVRRGLLSRLDHAAYLGAELEKARVALDTGRSYAQDEEIFPRRR